MEWQVEFYGLQSVGWTVAVVSLIAVAIGISVWLLRSELQLVSRPVARSLLLLRAMLLMLLLGVLLEPALVRRSGVDGQDEVVVAIDVSGSMQSDDRHAAPKELLAWAQGLGLLPTAMTEEDRSRWLTEAVDTAVELETVTDGLDLRQREQLLADVGRMSRKQLVQRLLHVGSTGILNELQQLSDVRLMTFADTSEEVDEQLLSDLLELDSANIAGGTDIAELLNRVVTTSQTDGAKSVVMFSDGRHTGPGSAVDVARQLGALQIPVYVVPIGSVHLPKDVIARPVDSPGSIFADDKATVRCAIAAAGYNGEELMVRLRQNGQLLKQKSVRVQDDRANASFVLPQLPVGHHDLRVEVGILPGELSEENNSQTFSIAVVDNQARVILVEQEPRWEFRYLYNLLDRDERIDLSTILFGQPFLEILNGPAYVDQLPELRIWDSQLETADMLVVGDVSPQSMSAAAWKSVARSVADDGLTLVVIPGRRQFTELLKLGSLQQLLPIESARSLPAEAFSPTARSSEQSVFRLVPLPAAEGMPMFQLQPGNDNQSSIFKELPGHPWILSGTARPAAAILAEAMIQTTGGQKTFPLIVHQYFGSGQVIWMGMDSTWRWRRRAGDSWHHRFWGQLVRWAVRNKSAIGSDDARLVVSSEYIGTQQSADVAVRWSASLATRLADHQVRVIAELQNSDATDETSNDPVSFVLHPGAAGPQQYTARISGLTAGRYRLRLDTDGLPFDLPEPISVDLVVMARATPELTNISCHSEYLAQIAGASGGQLVEPQDVRTIPSLLRPSTPTQAARRIEETLWDQWPVLIAFLVLLMAQWVVRKLSGLP